MSRTSQLVRGMLLSALVTGPAAAQTGGDADPVEALAAQGLECFQKRDFNCAVDKYREAYRIEPVAALLYNIAFIYDKKLEQLQLARDYYFRYVKAPDPDPDTKLAALERIVEIDQILQTKKPDPKDEPKQPPPPPPPPDKTQLYAGWATLGAGVVIGGLGGVFGLLASQAADTQSSTTDPAEWNDIRDSGPTQALIGDIGMAVGGAAVIAGLVLVLTYDEGDSAKPETGASIQVAPSASGLGLIIGGSF